MQLSEILERLGSVNALAETDTPVLADALIATLTTAESEVMLSRALGSCIESDAVKTKDFLAACLGQIPATSKNTPRANTLAAAWHKAYEACYTTAGYQFHYLRALKDSVKSETLLMSLVVENMHMIQQRPQQAAPLLGSIHRSRPAGLRRHDFIPPLPGNAVNTGAVTSIF